MEAIRLNVFHKSRKYSSQQDEYRSKTIDSGINSETQESKGGLAQLMPNKGMERLLRPNTERISHRSISQGGPQQQDA